MSAPTTIPLTITPEAAARVEELGMKREFEEMLEHTRQTVAGLHSIEVEAWDDRSEPGQPRLVMTAWREGEDLEKTARVTERWDSWCIRTFPPDVFRWFIFHAWEWVEDER